MSEQPKHEYGPDDRCVVCKRKDCSDAFWAILGAPPGTRGLRLRGTQGTWIPDKDRKP